MPVDANRAGCAARTREWPLRDWSRALAGAHNNSEDVPEAVTCRRRDNRSALGGDGQRRNPLGCECLDGGWHRFMVRRAILVTSLSLLSEAGGFVSFATLTPQYRHISKQSRQNTVPSATITIGSPSRNHRAGARPRDCQRLRAIADCLARQAAASDGSFFAEDPAWKAAYTVRSRGTLATPALLDRRRELGASVAHLPLHPSPARRSHLGLRPGRPASFPILTGVKISI